MLKASYKKTRLQTSPEYSQPYINTDLDTGLIKNVSLVTTGEAKGHEFFIDASFIADVVKLGNEFKAGLKARFGHPNLSGEALGTYLGRFKNFRVQDNKAIADLQLDPVAKQSPGGDLYSWVISMTKSNPDQFGASIVFDPGEDYQIIDGKKYSVEYDEEGNRFASDPEAPVYTSIKTLYGADLVDEPAANAGLFSAQFNADKFAVRVTEFLDSNPDIWSFIDKHPEKFTPFLSRYNAYCNKKISASDKTKVMKLKTKKGFFQKLAAAFTGDDDLTALAQIDAETTDGQMIRVDAAGDAPAVGDPVFITDPATDTQTVAPDGDYTIAGGDYDGYKLTVVGGLVSAVYNPDIPAVEVQQAAVKTYKQLQQENKLMQGQLSGMNKKIKELQDQFEAYKKQPLAEHTNVIPEGDGGTPAPDKDQQFYSRPWNKKARKIAG